MCRMSSHVVMWVGVYPPRALMINFKPGPGTIMNSMTNFKTSSTSEGKTFIIKCLSPTVTINLEGDISKEILGGINLQKNARKGDLRIGCVSIYCKKINQRISNCFKTSIATDCIFMPSLSLEHNFPLVQLLKICDNQLDLIALMMWFPRIFATLNLVIKSSVTLR